MVFPGTAEWLFSRWGTLFFLLSKCNFSQKLWSQPLKLGEARASVPHLFRGACGWHPDSAWRKFSWSIILSRYESPSQSSYFAQKFTWNWWSITWPAKIPTINLEYYSKQIRKLWAKIVKPNKVVLIFERNKIVVKIEKISDDENVDENFREVYYYIIFCMQSF